MNGIGILEVKCVWVNDNAFYWHCVEIEVSKIRGLFDRIVRDEKKTYKIASIEAVFSIAEKLSWDYKHFTLILDKGYL